MRPRSLRGRVTTVGVITLALVLGLGSWVMVRALAAATRSDTTRQNEEVLEGLAAQVADGVDPRTIVVPLGSDGTEFVIFDENTVPINFSFIGPGVTELAVTQTAEGFFIVEDPLLGTVVIADPTLSGASVEVIGGNFTDQVAETDWFETTMSATSPSGEVYTLLAVSPFGVVSRSTTRVALALAIIVPLLVLLGGIALWLAIGAALRPVQQISDEAKRIAPSTSGDRLPVPQSRDEIADLTITLNGMLDRLDAGLIRQRQFVSDASHELRSPMTAVRASAELMTSAADLPPRLNPTAGALQRGALRLESVLDDLTELVDSGVPARRAEVDLDDLVLGAVKDMQVPEAIEVDVSGVQPAVVRAHDVSLSRAISNIFSNALRHADCRVAISAALHDGEVSITIDDDGPGVPLDDRTRIFERFVRLDDGRQRSLGGSGLGLALATSIAHAHSGELVCEESPLGGARFVLKFDADDAFGPEHSPLLV